MTDYEIVAARGNFRVRLANDQEPQEPYNDGSSPLLRFSHYTYAHYVQQVTEITSYVLPAEIIEAGIQLDRDVFERYLRIFHGATTIEWWFSQGDNFVTFDTDDWRKAMGIGEAEPGVIYADMSEWKSYCEGEVYGVIVEECTPKKATREQLDAAFELLPPGATYRDVTRAADGELEDEEEWTEVDAVWGYYGTDYATETARERLDEYAS
jgi:hypothetical protein